MARRTRRVSVDDAIDEIRPTIEVYARKFAAQAPRHIDIDTRDMEQDAYVGVLRALPRYNGSTKVSTFMRRRVFGSIVDGLHRWNPRSRLAHIGYRIQWMPMPADAAKRWAATTPDPERSYLAVQLWKAISLLDGRTQRILALYYIDGLTQKEIARELRTSISTVAVARLTALDHLREILT